MIFLALGTNLGDRAGQLAQALELLAKSGIKIQRASSILETPALLPEGAPRDWDIPFLNQVLQVETSLSPLELLAVAQRIEREMGRQDRGKWGPREIDIDIIAYHEQCRDEAPLTMPHPQMHLRRFVLAPMLEIAPKWRHPVSGKSLQQLIGELPNA